MTGEVKTLQFAEGTSLTGAPTTFFLNTSGLLTYANDAAFVSAKGTAAANGDAYKNTTDGYIHFYDTAWRIVDSRKINATTADPGVNDDNTSGYEVNSKWINTTTGKYFIAKSVGTGAASWIELVDIASTQTISGVKTYTETSTHDKELILKSISTPSSPAASYLKLYNKSDSLYYKNSGGTETQIATGSGQIYGAFQALNYSLHCSVASNALTITLKGGDGNDLSGSNVFRCLFRSTTLSSGVYSSVDTTSNLSIVISSGSTLGHGDGFDSSIWVYALNNGGTVELAVSNVYFDEKFTWSTTAEGGAGGADTGGTLYSTTARTSKAIKLLGRIVSNQTTAGTWATTPQYINLGGVECNPNLIVYQPTLQNNHGDWNQWIGQFEYVRLFTNTGTPYYSLKFTIDGYSNSAHPSNNWVIPGIQIKAAVSGHVPGCAAGSTSDINQPIWVYQVYSAGVSYILASTASGGSANQFGITGQVLLDAVPKWA